MVVRTGEYLEIEIGLWFPSILYAIHCDSRSCYRGVQNCLPEFYAYHIFATALTSRRKSSNNGRNPAKFHYHFCFPYYMMQVEYKIPYSLIGMLMFVCFTFPLVESLKRGLCVWMLRANNPLLQLEGIFQ